MTSSSSSVHATPATVSVVMMTSAFVITDYSTSNNYNSSFEAIAATNRSDSFVGYGNVSSSSYSIVFQTLLITIGSTGAAANVAIMTALCLFGELSRNTTNVYIANQTVIDTVACLAVIVNVAMQMSGAFDNQVGSVAWIICLLFRNNGILVSAAYASQAGLVIIAVERYFQVVHPVAHRMRFRPWMLRAGLVAPWLDGIVVYLIPIASTTRLDRRGRCLNFYAWSSITAAETYTIVSSAWQFAVPIVVFVFCYGSILMVIRRRKFKIRPTHLSERREEPSGASAARVMPVEQELAMEPSAKPSVGRPERSVTDTMQATSTSAGSAAASDRQKRTVKVMTALTLCYAVCWLPVTLANVIYTFTRMTQLLCVFQLLALIAYVSILLNPIIYSAHLNVFGRFWRTCRPFIGIKNVGSGVGPVAQTDRQSATSPSEASVGYH